MFDFDALVGMSEQEAETKLKDAALVFRVTSRDGDPLMMTMDYQENRVNLDITEGKVVRTHLG